MESALATDGLSGLIAQLDEAVRAESDSEIAARVKEVLHDVVAAGESLIPANMLRPAEGCYARRLLHKDPEERYSVLAMVWDRGQGTPLHDHAGRWCVECVYQGRIKVVSYAMVSSEDAEILRFNRETEVFAGVSDAGALIPPFEYHTLENAEDFPAVTLHVYAGELDHCCIFVPTDGGGYRRQRKELKYTP